MCGCLAKHVASSCWPPAQEVFVTRGYHAAAMDEIADRAGVSKPVLYQHFPASSTSTWRCSSSRAKISSIGCSRHSKAPTTTITACGPRSRPTSPSSTTSPPPSALIFESDLTNEPAVGSIVEGGTDQRCALAISDVISADTGLPEDQAMLVATGLTGMAQTAARFWLREQGRIPRDQASQIMSVLAWRRVSGVPKTH